MENAIIIHNFASSDLEELIKKVVIEQLQEFRNKSSTGNLQELLTRAETCLLLDINLTILSKWTKKGKIIAYEIGNRVLCKNSELMGNLIKIN
jgi:uncharacterized membrane-anchored protein YjiN (DUF445 family)